MPERTGARSVLTYCTNVHPGESSDEVLRSLERWSLPLVAELRRRSADVPEPFPLGLWLSSLAVEELADETMRHRFRDRLGEMGLQVATLNCFPFGGFHRQRVKEGVFRPDWRDQGRERYTTDAARVLADLLAEGATAAISTSSGTLKEWGDDASDHEQMARRIARTAQQLALLLTETGREIVLSLEPEPFSTLETTDEVIAFFEGPLLGGAGIRELEGRGLSLSAAEQLLRRHVGVCFDTCHQAVEFEDTRVALERLHASGVRIGKLQLSSALAVPTPGADPEAMEALARFDEPRYLHQTFVLDESGSVRRFFDLPAFLEAGPRGLEEAVEARVHFHVPIDREDYAPLATTRTEMVRAVEAAVELEVTGLYEVETYTFSVLPRAGGGLGGSDDLVEALANELVSADQELRSVGAP